MMGNTDSSARTIEDRLSNSEVDASGCRLWLGWIDPDGYGQTRIDGRLHRVHRLSWEAVNGAIPAGMVIDHMCHVRACINVDHLQVVTRKQNNENRSGAQVNSASGIRGVSWDAKRQKWRADVGHNGRVHWAGTFGSIAEAETAAITLRKRLLTNSLADA